MSEINKIVFETKIKEGAKTAAKVAGAGAVGAGVGYGGAQLGKKASAGVFQHTKQKMTDKLQALGQANKEHLQQIKSGEDGILDKAKKTYSALKQYGSDVKGTYKEHLPTMQKAHELHQKFGEHAPKAAAIGGTAGAAIGAGLAARKYLKSRKK